MLLVVTGPPGAGKSVVAHELVKHFDLSVLVAGDSFFGFLAEGAVAPWLPESQAQNEVVTRAAASAAGEHVRGGYTTVYDGVVGPWFLPIFAAATGLDSLHYVILIPSVDRCVERVRTRLGHGFTDEPATRKMHNEFSAATVDPRHVLIDPSDDVAEVADLVLMGVAERRFVYQSGGSRKMPMA